MQASGCDKETTRKTRQMTRSGRFGPPAKPSPFLSWLDDRINPPPGSGKKLLRFVGTENPWGAARGRLFETSSIPFVMQVILGKYFGTELTSCTCNGADGPQDLCDCFRWQIHE